MTRHLLVRWPDRRRPPPGTFGRVELVPPRVYCKVADRAAFEAWAGREGLLADCGHVPPATEKLLRRRVAAAAGRGPVVAPDGLQVRSDGVTRVRVWPVVLHAGDRPGAFLWESPVLVGRSDQRKTRSQRRARWRTGSARAAAGCARGAGSTRRSRLAPGKSGGGRRRRSAGR